MAEGRPDSLPRGHERGRKQPVNLNRSRMLMFVVATLGLRMVDRLVKGVIRPGRIARPALWAVVKTFLCCPAAK